VCVEIQRREFFDDRMVALTLAFALYRQNGRPRRQRDRLKLLAAADVRLKDALTSLLRPSARVGLRRGRQETDWKRRSERQKEREAKDLERAKLAISKRIPALRQFGKPGEISQDQHYLHDYMRRNCRRQNRWAVDDWRVLIPVFGQAVASAFRDGVVAYWRGGCPPLRSEGAPPNSITLSAILGLSGISIEAKESPQWAKRLTAADARLATRYALQEINGFPRWLAVLHEVFPSEVEEVILGEVEYELATEATAGEQDYVLYDVRWHGEWLWSRVGPWAVSVLSRRRPNVKNLAHLLGIVHRASIDDLTIARVALGGAESELDISASAMWFASWVGSDPDAAIPALADRLAKLDKPADQTELASRFIVALLGGRSQDLWVRRVYRAVPHLIRLYLLLHRYVRVEEDTNRGSGVYSPWLRDEAQESRDALLSFVRETPGKEAFLALLDLGETHPQEASRPWMVHYAKVKAALDADVRAWTPTQVREFHQERTCTPSGHRELWDLGVLMLAALKHDLEHGDTSIASILQRLEETQLRKYIGGWCRDRARGRYGVVQEEELADAKRPDLRFQGVGFDAPVPIEIKVADNWSGRELFDGLERQLCGDYLRDARSSRGVFALVYRGTRQRWELPCGRRADQFDELVVALRDRWLAVSRSYSGVDDVAVIGLDLTRRGATP
jgi:hypothetical protein